MPQPTPLVACVLVNWNGWPDTLPCIASLLEQDYPSLHIIVVDNGSTDDSVARIRAAFPKITLLESGANRGFASGANLGSRHAVRNGAAFVWQLNNDTLCPPDTCSKLVARTFQTPQVGMVGSVLYYLQDPARIQAWGGGDLLVWLGRSRHFSAPAALGPTGYLTFASVLIPREVLCKVGVLYEGLFLYWEDADFALRVTKAGYRLVVAEDTAILHKEGGTAERRSPSTDRYATASGLHFLRRHSPVPRLSMALFVAMKFTARLLRLHPANARAVLHGLTDYRRQRQQSHSETL